MNQNYGFEEIFSKEKFKCRFTEFTLKKKN